MAIPKQLKGMRFNRVKFKEKRAFENGWQKNPYTYEEISKFFPKENYGVICGHDIRALDDDTPNEDLKKIYNDNFQETMEVRGHIYFKFNNSYPKKIIFNHPTILFKDSNGKKSSHMGELQGEGTYVVGPGSIHPSGENYNLKKDLPIATISYNKFNEVFKDYIKIRKQQIVREHKSTDWKGDNVSDIPIGNIISFVGLIDMDGGNFQGSHPYHGSTNGNNFRVNTIDNTWFCFRCWTGGGPSELIAVMEGIVDCSDISKGCFSESQGQEIIKVAREKYGLEVPDKQQDLGEVKGWANSVSITKLAKKHNFENCHICGKPWKLQESHGMYYCPNCKFGGGLKKFAELISKKINKENT